MPNITTNHAINYTNHKVYVLCLTVRVFIIYEMVNVGDSCFMKFVVSHRGIFFDSSFVKLISHDTVKHHLPLPCQ